MGVLPEIFKSAIYDGDGLYADLLLDEHIMESVLFEHKDRGGHGSEKRGGRSVQTVNQGQSLTNPTVKFNRADPVRFVKARDTSKRGGYLTGHTASELADTVKAGGKLFLSEDNKVGYVLSPTGDLQNVFNNGGPHGSGGAAVRHAIANGAKTLDCFNGFLPHFYEGFGFKEKSRLKWDDQYAPANWDYNKEGRPDVIFMEYQGGKQKLTESSNRSGLRSQTEGTGGQAHRQDGAEVVRRQQDDARLSMGAVEGTGNLIESVDAHKHIHKDKGPGGGQFAKTSANTASTKAAATPKLKEGHSQYFAGMGTATLIPLSKLIPTRARPEGIKNAAVYMQRAAEGKGEKRSPIKVTPTDGGMYNILDGNSTFANARENGWKNIPAYVLSKEEAEKEAKQQSEEGHKKAMSKLASKSLFAPEEMTLPPNNIIPQPVDNKEALYQHAQDAFPAFQRLLDLGKGLAVAIGGKAVYAGDEKAYKDALASPDKVVIVAALKGEKRAGEKAEKLGGWKNVDDIVRATIGVNSVGEVEGAISALRTEMRKEGWTFNQSPYNRFENPTRENYRDINFRIKAPNGHICEVQLNTKAMLIAKNIAHPYYEESRVLDPKSPDDKNKKAELSEKQREIYDAAWKKSWGGM